MDIDSILNLSLVGLTAFGAVNVLNIFAPTSDSRIKFTASLLTAFAVSWVPADIQNVVLNHAREALQAALVVSGVYKMIGKTNITLENKVEEKPSGIVNY